jgi:hypothetical protein
MMIAFMVFSARKLAIEKDYAKSSSISAWEFATEAVTGNVVGTIGVEIETEVEGAMIEIDEEEEGMILLTLRLVLSQSNTKKRHHHLSSPQRKREEVALIITQLPPKELSRQSPKMRMQIEISLAASKSAHAAIGPSSQPKIIATTTSTY